MTKIREVHKIVLFIIEKKDKQEEEKKQKETKKNEDDNEEPVKGNKRRKLVQDDFSILKPSAEPLPTSSSSSSQLNSSSPMEVDVNDNDPLQQLSQQLSQHRDTLLNDKNTKAAAGSAANLAIKTYYNGYLVYKYFEEFIPNPKREGYRVFCGVVKGHDGEYWDIVYQDNDREEMTDHEVKKYSSKAMKESYDKQQLAAEAVAVSTDADDEEEEEEKTPRKRKSKLAPTSTKLEKQMKSCLDTIAEADADDQANAWEKFASFVLEQPKLKALLNIASSSTSLKLSPSLSTHSSSSTTMSLVVNSKLADLSKPNRRELINTYNQYSSILINSANPDVYVNVSSIPGANRGLFARNSIAKGSLVCWFGGKAVDKVDASKLNPTHMSAFVEGFKLMGCAERGDPCITCIT